MLKEKAKSKYKDHEETLDHLLATQEYIIDSSNFFIDSLKLEKELKLEESRRLMGKSAKMKELAAEETNVCSDFIKIIQLFANCYESTGREALKNYTKFQENASYYDLETLSQGIKESKHKTKKESIMDKLAPLSKMRNSRSKKQYQYETAIQAAEEALKKAHSVLNDPSKAYEYTKKEVAQEKAVNALRNLDEAKIKLKNHMEMLNEYQKTCIDIMKDLMIKTDQSVDTYARSVLTLWILELNNYEDNMNSVENVLMIPEFMEYNSTPIVDKKMTTSSTKLKLIKDHLEDSGEINIDTLKEYKEYIFTFIKNEKDEFEQTYYLIHQFKIYLQLLISVKEAANKKLEKLIKNAKRKVGSGSASYYNYEFPIVEIWELLLYKYGKMIKSNVAYIKFLKELKPTCEEILKNFQINSKSNYKTVCNLYETENLYLEYDDDIDYEKECMVKLCNSLFIFMHESFPNCKTFIKSIHECLSDLVAYQAVTINQEMDIIKKQRCFLQNYDENTKKFRTPEETVDSKVTSISFLGDFDLIPEYIEEESKAKSDEEGRPKSEEVKMPAYKEKDRSRTDSDYGDGISKISDDNSNGNSESGPGADKDQSSVTIYKKEEILKMKDRIKPSQTVIDDLNKESALYQIVEFFEIKNDYIQEERKQYEESLAKH